MPDVHLFPNDAEGHAVLHQLQQRAEAWAEGVSLAEAWLTLGDLYNALFYRRLLVPRHDEEERLENAGSVRL
jgi:hypothetical protein